jgi:hypothetical protein
VTWGAIKLARLTGPERFRRLARPYLKATA